MGMQRGVPDPYRQLGVQRAATGAQIKAAHRKLAKRYHPDAPEGNTMRFVAIQEAYLLLSDPLRRREWDTHHAPGPVRAGEPGRRPQKPRASDGRWTRQEGAKGGARSRQSGGQRRSQGTRTDGADRPAADPADARATPDFTASERDPSTRSYRWTAENVPWWEDFSPHGSRSSAGGGEKTGGGQRPTTQDWPKGAARREDRVPGTNEAGERAAGESASHAAGEWAGRRTAGGGESGGGWPGAGASGGSRARAGDSQGPEAPTNASARADHGDVYSRSSGAAWSSAARQYFRKASEDLPSRGAFMYRGTQVVTGAKAREASEELLKRRPAVGPSPRQAFEPRPADRPSTPWAGQSRPPSSRSADPGMTQPSSDAQSPSPPTASRNARPSWSPGDPFDRPADGVSGRDPSLLGAASVGAAASFAVTLPLLVLGSFVLNPPLQPVFAALLLLLAALTGAVAAAVWVRVRPDV